MMKLNQFLRPSVRKKALPCVILLIFLSSCATIMSSPVAQTDIETIRLPYEYMSANPNLFDTINTVNKRNRAVEDDPKWIEESYQWLKIRKLNSIPEKEFEQYAKFLDKDSVYIIVHPAYYPLFQYKKIPSNDATVKLNAVDKFLSITPPDIRFTALQAQERYLRDFLEYKSTEGKLIILVMPKNYGRYKGYTYKEGPDEFMRYLNEVTNYSKSVVYIESRSAVTGFMTEEDSLRLREFLLSIGAKTILLGGGYVGRCLEDFYVDLSEDQGSDNIFIVPELSSVSPRELSAKLSASLVKPDGTIDIERATLNIRTAAYDSQEFKPNVQNLQ